MPYTLGQLKDDLLPIMFPAGRAKNLRAAHNKLFIEALINIQDAVQCNQVNNIEIVPFCSTYFQCGMTVFEAPRGMINKLSTYVRLDEDCAEDADSAISWCTEIPYVRVDYTDLVKLVDKRLRCCASAQSCGVSCFADLAALSVFNCQKVLGQAYNAPDDADYVGFPHLPMGFHFAQSSTDTTRRATAGVWALHHGRIYVAPWINSSEVIVVEWDGIKRVWTDDDVVDDIADPYLQNVVQHYVLMHHYATYERDPEMARFHRDEYAGNPAAGIIGALPAMISRCREETRERAERETNSHSRRSNQTLVEQACELPTTPTGISYQLPVTSWTPGDGDLDQEIWRSVDGSEYALLATVGPAVESYFDSTWDQYPEGTVLLYKVRGRNSCDYSSFTDPVGGPIGN